MNRQSVCNTIGNTAHQRLSNILISKGFIVKNADVYSDMVNKYDIIACLKGKEAKIQIKAIPNTDKLHRTVEFVCKRNSFTKTNDLGWIFQQADYIAYEINNGFLMIKMKDIKTFIENKLMIEDAVYSHFSETYVYLDKTLPFKEMIIKYYNDLKSVRCLPYGSSKNTEAYHLYSRDYDMNGNINDDLCCKVPLIDLINIGKIY